MNKIDRSIVAALVQRGYSDYADYYESLVEAQAYWSGTNSEEDEE